MKIISSLAICFTFFTHVYSQAPILNNGRYSFSFNNIYFEVDPYVGGRISSFKLNQKEVLFTTRENGNNWGSTFWPAPQIVWNWPPPDTLDNKPYASSVRNNVLRLKSLPNIKTPGCQFIKTFKASPSDNSIIVNYKIINLNATSSSFAPWQIARVPSGGLTFFPTGTTNATGDLSSKILKSYGVTWFDYDSSNIPGGVPKLFADGSEGWLAHVNNQRQLLLFKFTDSPVSKKAPGEDEIELYVNPDRSYVELEPLGPYTSIMPGDSLEWEVMWYIRAIPSNITVKAGSEPLLSFVRKIISESALTLGEKESLEPNVQFLQGQQGVSIICADHHIEQVVLTDAIGKNVLTQSKIQSDNFFISKETLKGGIYLITVETEMGRITKRLYLDK